MWGLFLTSNTKPKFKAMKRMYANDYRREYQDRVNQLEKLDAQIRERLLLLGTEYPEAPIAKQAHTTRNSTDDLVNIKASSLNKSYVDDCTIEVCIVYIQAIEAYVAGQHPHKQLDLFDKTREDSQLRNNRL